MDHPDRRPLAESYWVVPGRFLAGEYPGHWLAEEARRRLDLFLQAGFDTFIDLTFPGELEPYETILYELANGFGLKAAYHRFPVNDFGLPDPEQMHSTLDAIDLAISSRRKLYLHCLGGIGRTGTTVGCFLVRHGMNGEQALRQLAGLWQEVPKSSRFTQSPETPLQRQFILDWQEAASGR